MTIIANKKARRMQFAQNKKAKVSGFTLIELSIVLVIIGLIVGGILVGRELINAAEVRATISQITKYNTAVNAFRLKFNYLPGDMPDPYATQCGFVARGGIAGQGDGNGIIDGGFGPASFYPIGGILNQTGTYATAFGETAVFWEDLSTAGLIEGGFNSATETIGISVSNNALPQYVPAAKIGRGNYFYITQINSTNYFGIEDIQDFNQLINEAPTSMTVAQAYNIDKKIDDGLPTTGTVAAMVTESGITSVGWVLGTGTGLPLDPYVPSGSIFTGQVATPGTVSNSYTCFDSPAGAVPVYSMEQNGGNNPNCGLVIRFQ